MSSHADRHLLEQVEAIARGAGSEILAVSAREFSVQEKADRSPLTEADAAAHRFIAQRLARLRPALPVLSEEAVDDFPADCGGAFWLVDPLDGTKEFIKRNGEFTVNIAMIRDGRPVLGVVHAPALDRTYVAAEGSGAFRTIGRQDPEPIRVAFHGADSPWRVAGSRSHAGDSLAAFLRHLGPHELLSMGSSLKFCLVAEGAADLYPRLGPTSLWDTAAAQCVVEQAGGGVVDLTGAPLSYRNPAVLLNPSFLAHGKSDQDWPVFLLSAGLVAETPGGRSRPREQDRA